MAENENENEIGNVQNGESRGGIDSRNLRKLLADKCKALGYMEVLLPNGTVHFWAEKLKELNNGVFPNEMVEQIGMNYEQILENTGISARKRRYYLRNKEKYLQWNRERYARLRNERDRGLVESLVDLI